MDGSSRWCYWQGHHRDAIVYIETADYDVYMMYVDVCRGYLICDRIPNKQRLLFMYKITSFIYCVLWHTPFSSVQATCV